MIYHPHVSICIPAFNQTEYLKRTLDSIIIQDYKDYEIIVTDDSLNNSVERLIKKYDFNGRLKYIKNKERKGTPANWNEAVKFASGDYIKIIHHDDWFANSTCLQEYVELLDKNPEADFAFSSCNSIQGNIVKPWLIKHNKLADLKKDPFCLILGNFIGAPSVTIYRRRFNGNFDEALKWLVDLDFYIRILENNRSFVTSSGCLMNICGKGTHQVTNECLNNADIELSEYVYLYNKYYGQFKLDKRHYQLLQNIFGRYNIRSINDLGSVRLISDIPESIKISLSTGEKIRLLIDKVCYSVYRKLKAGKNKLLNLNIKPYKKSYSQCGEDLIVDYIFRYLHIENPSYMDIGAHHPFKLSNTAFFYNKGCTGINIEPNSYLIEEFKKYRKRDINLNIGIARNNEELVFYFMSSPTMSTFSLEEAKRLEQETSMRIVEQKKIMVKSLKSVLETYNRGIFPDFLSLDVEGFEDEILGSIDYEKNYPKVICLETLTYSECNKEKKEIDVINALISKGYFVYGETYINTIFVRESIWRNR